MALFQDNEQSEAGYMSGGKSQAAGENEEYDMTGLEVGTICGTIVAFFMVMFFVFYCRRIDTRRKKPHLSSSSSSETVHEPGREAGEGGCLPTVNSTRTKNESGGINLEDKEAECTEMKTMSPVPMKDDKSDDVDVDVTIPERAYRSASERGLRDSDLEAGYPEGGNGKDDSKNGKKRFSSMIVFKVGSWRAGQKNYSRTSDGDSNV